MTNVCLVNDHYIPGVALARGPVRELRTLADDLRRMGWPTVRLVSLFEVEHIADAELLPLGASTRDRLAAAERIAADLRERGGAS